MSAGVRSFANIIEGLGEGGESVNDECSAKLQALVAMMQKQSVARQMKVRGKFTLTLDISINSGSAEVEHDIKVKEPRVKRAPFPATVTKGGLSTQMEIRRNDPNAPAGPLDTTNVTPSREV